MLIDQSKGPESLVWRRNSRRSNWIVVRAAANIAFAQSPTGIGRKRPSLPGQLPGDRASAVPLQLPQMRPVLSSRSAS
jgi:hypothetical protein